MWHVLTPRLLRHTGDPSDATPFPIASGGRIGGGSNGYFAAWAGLAAAINLFVHFYDSDWLNHFDSTGGHLPEKQQPRGGGQRTTEEEKQQKQQQHCQVQVQARGKAPDGVKNKYQ